MKKTRVEISPADIGRPRQEQLFENNVLKLTLDYEWDNNGILRALTQTGKDPLSRAELLSVFNQKFIERIEYIDLIKTINTINTIGNIQNIANIGNLVYTPKYIISDPSFETGIGWLLTHYAFIANVGPSHPINGFSVLVLPSTGVPFGSTRIAYQQLVLPIKSDWISSFLLWIYVNCATGAITGQDTVLVKQYYSDGTLQSDTLTPTLGQTWQSQALTLNAGKYITMLSVAGVGNDHDLYVDDIETLLPNLP